MKIDHLIVGQGLAGSLLAWHLLAKGRRILVVDRDEAVTSSKVAAGLATPLPGMQFSLPDGFEETLDFAKKTYWDIEETIGRQFFHHCRIVRLFAGDKEFAKWNQRLSNPERTERYREFHDSLQINENWFHAENGGIELKKGGWLNVADFVEALRIHLLERLAYAIGKVDSREIQNLPDGGVKWKNITAGNIIFCEGWRATENHYFEAIPMNSARGDILRCRCETIKDEQRIINRHGWLLPLGHGEFRAGASYDHDFQDTAPTEAGRKIVEEKIKGILLPEYEVMSHASAVQPIIQRSRVFMGRHPEFPDIVYFNGLGSKGVINAPFQTHALVEHLTESKPLQESVDIQRHFTF
ncbi:MAG: FAD-dependent oxidoreductase [Verrucomicrobiales bacterium]|nr:FAD-dependent oxidoreductase [Verrucomicrobiales bacterium]